MMIRDSFTLKGRCAVCNHSVSDQTVKWCLNLKKLGRVYCFDDMPKTVMEVMKYYTEKHALV